MYPYFTTRTLKNGLTVYIGLLPESYFKFTYGKFIVHSGTKDAKGGIAHFSEHMSFDNIDKLNKFAENCAGSIKPGTTYSSITCYDFCLITRGLKKAFDIFGDSLLNQKITNDEVERQRIIISNEHREEATNHLYVTEDLTKDFKKSLYQDHWKAEDIYEGLGYLDEIAKISKEDLQSFCDQHYVPENISLIILTPEPVEKVLELLNKSQLTRQKPGKRNPLTKPLCTTWKPDQKLRSLSILKSGSNSLKITCILPGNIPKSVIEIAREMIQSQLKDELTEKKPLFRAVGFTASFYSDLWELTISCRNIPEGSNREIVKMVDKCLSKTLLSKSIFNRFKNKLIKKYANLDLSQGINQIIEDSMVDLIIYNKIQSIGEKLESYTNVKFEEVKQLLSYFEFNSRLTINTSTLTADCYQ